MTKKEHAAMQKHINTVYEYRKDADKVFKRLQDLNEAEGTGCRWCSAEQNTKDLLSCGKDYLYLFERYTRAQAKIEMIDSLGCVLADIGFWN